MADFGFGFGGFANGLGSTWTGPYDNNSFLDYMTNNWKSPQSNTDQPAAAPPPAPAASAPAVSSQPGSVNQLAASNMGYSGDSREMQLAVGADQKGMGLLPQFAPGIKNSDSTSSSGSSSIPVPMARPADTSQYAGVTADEAQRSSNPSPVQFGDATYQPQWPEGQARDFKASDADSEVTRGQGWGQVAERWPDATKVDPVVSGQPMVAQQPGIGNQNIAGPDDGDSLPAKASPVAWDRQKYAYNYFTQRGYTPAQAAGIVGGLKGETANLNTTESHDNGIGYGIAGWNGDRLAGLQQYAAANKLDPKALDTQLGYVDHELRNGESKAGDAIRAAQTPQQAAQASLSYFRPANWNQPGAHADRAQYAGQIYSQYGQPQQQAPARDYSNLYANLYSGRTRQSIDGMQPNFRDGLSRMLADAPPEVRSAITINSGFRDNDYQAGLFRDAVKKYGSVDAARKWVAPPGHSQHNRGTAADLGFANDTARDWVHANANKYGLNFPMAHEPWHIEAAGARGGQTQFASNTPQTGDKAASSWNPPSVPGVQTSKVASADSQPGIGLNRNQQKASNPFSEYGKTLAAGLKNVKIPELKNAQVKGAPTQDTAHDPILMALNAQQQGRYIPAPVQEIQT